MHQNRDVHAFLLRRGETCRFVGVSSLIPHSPLHTHDYVDTCAPQESFHKETGGIVDLFGGRIVLLTQFSLAVVWGGGTQTPSGAGLATSPTRIYRFIRSVLPWNKLLESCLLSHFMSQVAASQFLIRLKESLLNGALLDEGVFGVLNIRLRVFLEKTSAQTSIMAVLAL